ncbi:unnamed protein product [Toxocara canis]|uniref:Ribosomal_L18e/L15P domain-containing protein n=1 Tax=Toxocara canis TaxID=6265 RepID=A0A183UCK9_TOXCA|nr:unnamed protein product [Toxocara canis]
MRSSIKVGTGFAFRENLGTAPNIGITEVRLRSYKFGDHQTRAVLEVVDKIARVRGLRVKDVGSRVKDGAPVDPECAFWRKRSSPFDRKQRKGGQGLECRPSYSKARTGQRLEKGKLSV